MKMKGFSIPLLLGALLTGNCTESNGPAAKQTPATIPKTARKAVSTPLTPDNLVRDLANHPAFQGFGNLLLPWDDNTPYYATPLRQVSSLMPYHGQVRPAVVLSAVNHLIQEVNHGRNIFYPFYSPPQQRQDASKQATGLFFFRGSPGAPFAVICPGGGFRYVGSLHEGFPLAQQLSQRHLNAFVIRYRIGSERLAMEDLGAALAYIFSHAAELGVSPRDYSLWGGSAGARMVGNIALNGVAAYGGGDLPKPATAVIAYTGQASYSADFPPTFITVAANDGIASAQTVDRRVRNLQAAGVEVAYRRYQTAGHGFGTGQGSDAEGWSDEAIRFWQQHIRP